MNVPLRKAAWLLVVSALACSESKPAQRAQPARIPTLADLFPTAAATGMDRPEPELAKGDDLPGFLGVTGAPLLACGAMEGARVRYAMDADSELVALLLAFPSVDAARCGYDVGRPDRTRAADVPEATADVRDVEGLLEGHRLWVAVQGRHVVRLFAPPGQAVPRRAASLMQAMVAKLPEEPASEMLLPLPKVDMVPGSARVVSQGPVEQLEGLLAVASYRCGDDVVQGFAKTLESEQAAKAVRDTYQRKNLEAYQTVTPFNLGPVPVVSVVAQDSLRETLLMRHGRRMMGVANMARRRDCIPVIEAFAALRDASQESVDGGQP